MNLKRMFALILVFACVLISACEEPASDMEMYSQRMLTTYTPNAPLHIKWLGTAAIWLSDGETAILIDPFVTRPGLVETGVAALDIDTDYVKSWADSLTGPPVKAVLVSHSHYDHAMDAPYFAMYTGAPLVGSESTANIGRGYGLSEDQISVVEPEDKISYGRFTITMIESLHSVREAYPGDITEPVIPPAPSREYRTGTVFAFLIDHPAGRILHHNSANWIDGMYNNVRADVVLLGLASREDTPSYLDAVVVPVGAKLVIPIHCDDFFKPIEDGLSFLGIPDVNMMEYFETVNSYEGFSTATLPFAESQEVDLPVY